MNEAMLHGDKSTRGVKSTTPHDCEDETNLGATKAWAPAAQATAITADFIFEFRRWREKMYEFRVSDESLNANEGVGWAAMMSNSFRHTTWFLLEPGDRDDVDGSVLFQPIRTRKEGRIAREIAKTRERYERKGRTQAPALCHNSLVSQQPQSFPHNIATSTSTMKSAMMAVACAAGTQAFVAPR